MNPLGKYEPFPVINLDYRQWPSRVITYAPILCSVDLRDGNQALPVPMIVERKLEMFDVLVSCGFKEIVAMAVQGTKWVRQYSAALTAAGTEVIFQYSPESFSATEVEFALEVCEAVMDAWQPTPKHKMIINLPNTVEVAMPNVYADQIEWFCRHMTRRDCAVISIHSHNDRGTGVAATELGLLAGADRVEGTLFGNGERTGNVDIITVALNLFTQGIDPKLDFSNLDGLREVYERCTGMTVSSRQPYSGALVYTAFSGSHQDAIRKGLQAQMVENGCGVWDVPYLVIDPRDVGRKYEEVIRVNGQSGKGGIAYLLEQGCSVHLPKDMLREFGQIASKSIDALGREVTSAELKEMVWKEYIERTGPNQLEHFHSTDGEGGCSCQARITLDGEDLELSGKGNGPIDAFICSLRTSCEIDVTVLDQAEHALGEGSEASAVAYVQLRFPDGNVRWGAGVDTSIQLASIRAVVSALNRK